MTRAAFRASVDSVSSSKWLSTILAIVAAMVTLLFGMSTWTDYRATVERGWVTAESTAHVLEEQTNRALDINQLVTDRVIDAVRFQGLDHFRGSGWSDLVAAFAQAAPQIGSVWVLDDQANLVANSMTPNPPPANFADREYYVPLRDGAPVHMTGLLWGRVSNVWFFSYNQAIVIDGQFRGITQTSMHADYFRSFYEGLQFRPDATISIFRQDGTLMMRWSLRESDLAASAAETPLFRQHVPQQPAGRFETTSADGVQLLKAYRVLANQPLVVTAAIARDAVLAPFWGRFSRNAAVFALAALLIAVLTRLATRAARRERETAALERIARLELERQSTVLEAQRRDLADALAERERLLDLRARKGGAAAPGAGGGRPWPVGLGHCVRPGSLDRRPLSRLGP